MREADRRIQASREEADRQMRASREEADRQMRASREESDRRIQASWEESDRRMRESDRRMRASREESDRRMRESDRVIGEMKRETERIIREMKQKTERQKQESARILSAMKRESEELWQKTERQINKLDGKFGNLWGDLVEALIQGNLIEALKSRGLDVKKTVPSYTGHLNGRIKEYDLIALNGKEIVVVEAKSALDQKKADKFLKAMAQFKKYCPEFSHLTVYAGLACLRTSPEVIKYVIDKGLFMILVKGENAVFLNPEGSKPRVF